MVEPGFASLAITAQLLVQHTHDLNDDLMAMNLDTTPTPELEAVGDCLEAAASYLTSGRKLFADKLQRAAHGNPMVLDA